MGISCPVCLSTDHNQVGAHNDYTLHHCRACDVVFSDPMRSEASYYEDSIDYLLRDTLIMDPIKWDFRWDMTEFLRNPPAEKGTLLDIGCGTGYFVKRAMDMGYDAQGLETNPRSVDAGRAFFGIDSIHAMDLDGFISRDPDSKFNVVTLFQVLEHVEDPVGLLGEIRSIMARESVLVVAVPLRERWPDTSGEGGDCPPHHLTRWSPDALRYILENNGFRARRQVIEGFPLGNMPTFIYNYALRFLPSLTLKGKQVVSAEKNDPDIGINGEHTLSVLKKRRLKMRIATTAGFPLWMILKLLGARGPNIYIEAVRVQETH